MDTIVMKHADVLGCNAECDTTCFFGLGCDALAPVGWRRWQELKDDKQ
jgi:hypothetical protein